MMFIFFLYMYTSFFFALHPLLHRVGHPRPLHIHKAQSSTSCTLKPANLHSSILNSILNPLLLPFCTIIFMRPTYFDNRRSADATPTLSLIVRDPSSLNSYSIFPIRLTVSAFSSPLFGFPVHYSPNTPNHTTYTVL